MQSTIAAWYWAAPVTLHDGLPPVLRTDVDRIVDAMAGATGAAEKFGAAASADDGEPDGDGASLHERQAGLRAHVEMAVAAMTAPVTDGVPADLGRTVAALALHGPGNCAWRALSRLLEPPGAQASLGGVSEAGLWEAAAVLANGLRSVFARWESTLLLDGEVTEDVPYWRAVLTYCAWGNLQAVLDEYLHHLVADEGIQSMDDERIVALARRAAEAIAIRVSQYEAFDPTDPERALTFPSRFALRYGGRRVTQDDARQPEVRRAFNSPFWPFVLASTSVGQEGIDLHWWCHAVVHWNTPANPVDFEQREGRVNRYGGHAVRKNIATRHAGDIFASVDPDPWRAAYRVATDEHERCGDFAPYWVYPGPARIERHLLPFPLSVDRARYERLKEDVALYRLTFGQPRQEDMLELLRDRAVGGVAGPQRVDLRPPSRYSEPSISK